MSLLATAIAEQKWEAAALWLLLGVTRAAAALPPDALEELLEALEPAPSQEPRRREGERGARRGGRR